MTTSSRQPHHRPGPTDGAAPTRAARARRADERDTWAARTHGPDGAPPTRAARTHGPEGAPPTRAARTHGPEGAPPTRAARTHGPEGAPPTRAARTHGPDERETRSATLRRAVLGGAAGITILIGPVVMASALLPDGTGEAVAAADGSDTSQVALRQTTSTTEPTTTTAAPTTTTTAPTTTTTAPTTTTAAPTTTTAPPTTEPPPPDPGELPVGVDNGAGFPDPNSYETWDRLADCESGGRWDYSAGPYYGGLQFSASTWQSVGGPGLPYEYPRETQIYYGQILQARSGWGQWPHCSAQLGLI